MTNKLQTKKLRLGASFRDPNGFLFQDGEMLYRQVNQGYQENYDRLMESGLYDALVKAGLLVAHSEVEVKPLEPGTAYKVIQPERIGFISYPYEWSFSQLKDAALATLAIQRRAMKHGLSLKDSSAYNIQFRDGKPVLIDTLSFEVYPEGKAWIAYRQFCQHFLAPLALMAHNDVRLSQMMRVYIDGIPLDLASKLLPRRTRFNFGLLSHIHLHAAAQQRYSDKTVNKQTASRQINQNAFMGLLQSLDASVRKLTWNPAGTEWGEYYEDTNYSEAAMQHKEALVVEYLERIQPSSVWDLGANTGRFSRLASQRGIATVSFDIDPDAVEKNYRQIRANKEKHILPLLLDLTNPSPAMGWAHAEREALCQRGPADAVFALALVHHLAIANNVPLGMLAEFLSSLGSWLVIEFVPKSDSQVKRLLATREDIFPDYDVENFQKIFEQYFKVHANHAVADSDRHLFLMEARQKPQ